jgi:hypothetical protein
MPAPPEDLRRLYEYWRGLSARNFAQPYDPVTDLPDLSPDMMIVDLVAGRFEYRHFGAGIGRWLSTDLTGKPVGGSTLMEEVKLAWKRMLETVVSSRQPSLILIEGDHQTSNFILSLPMNNFDKPTISILTCLFFDPQAGPRIVIRGWKVLDIRILQQASG